jgi:aminoglycoside phosphotransferase (APT) family kinase protein
MGDQLNSEAKAMLEMEGELHVAARAPDDPVATILSAYGCPGPWSRLASTGIANRVYATDHVVLRVATDHDDAIVDALTESIAAPVARAAGILTPRLIAFDNSRKFVDRPFSLWERVHGETLGLVNLPQDARERVWGEVGQEIARLHQRVKSCPDDNGYLDTPGREMGLDLLLERFADSGQGSRGEVREIEKLISELRPFVFSSGGSNCFLHNDVHEWNVMCTSEGQLLALIDWGDAGWGDPTLDFAAIPFDAVCVALEGYNTTELLGEYAEARIVWDHLQNALDDAVEDPSRRVPMAEFRRFLERY